jgi:hypothetical protein
MTAFLTRPNSLNRGFICSKAPKLKERYFFGQYPDKCYIFFKMNTWRHNMLDETGSPRGMRAQSRQSAKFFL